MYKIGLSSCGFALTEENFQSLEESGIEVIEITKSMQSLETLDYKEVGELSRKYKIGLWSFHLPFSPSKLIDISSMDEDLRRGSVELHKGYIEKASDIGVGKFIVHPSTEPIPDCERGERFARSMESLSELAEIAHKNGAVIAVEDLPRSCLGNTSDEILKLLSANDKLRVCFDTNHLLTEDNVSFIEKLGDKIVTLHVSDYDFIDEKHWLPGEGKLDWSSMLGALKKVGYNGVWMYELGLKAPSSMPRSRDLTFGDFVNNAKEIFEGQTPSRIC